MTDAPKPKRPRRSSAVVANERRLLSEVLELKDQVHTLVVTIERNTNAHAQTQMLAQRDIAQLASQVKKLDEEKIAELEQWRREIETERSEARGAAKVRRSLLAIVAGVAGLAGSVIGAWLNYALRQGGG